jgi:hypothetical protein
MRRGENIHIPVLVNGTFRSLHSAILNNSVKVKVKQLSDHIIGIEAPSFSGSFQLGVACLDNAQDRRWKRL